MKRTSSGRRRTDNRQDKEWVTADGEERYILLDSSHDGDTIEYSVQKQVISPISGDFSGEQQLVIPKPNLDAALAMKLLVPISQATQTGLDNVDGIEEGRERLERAIEGRRKLTEHRWEQWATDTFGTIPI
jgi:hypothetical protein